MVSWDSAVSVGGLEVSPDLKDLLRVAGWMRGKHDQGFVASDRAGKEGMVGGQRARVISEVFDVFEDLGADGIEGGEGFVQARILAGWMRH